MRYSVILLFAFFSCLACRPRLVVSPHKPTFTETNKAPVKVDANKTPYTFGYLEVPENRQNPTGRTIKLPVYIFKSRNPNPAPDPVLYTVGGPGASSLGAAPYMRAFSYLDDRDLILFEQRGTQYARPHLACPEWAKATAALNNQLLSAAEREAIQIQATASCRDRLLRQNIDLNAYNTWEIAADIEDLRQVLNIKQLNLLTISYSTKIAQVMMRDYPSSIRSVVMDSPLPLAAQWDESSLTNLIETYEAIFADCAADSRCNTRYPKLGPRFFEFLQAATNTPIELDVDQPDGKAQTKVTLTGTDIATYLGDLYTGNVPAFPGMLNAVINGNREILRDNFSWSDSSGNGLGMRLSVWCSEETAFADAERVTAESQRYPFLPQASPMVFSYEVCRTWGVRPARTQENTPISSSIPTLLISGSYDAITPVKWAATLDQQLGNSHHLIFPGWTHTPTTYWNNNCAMQAAREFFNDPGRKSEVDCLEEIKVVFK